VDIYIIVANGSLRVNIFEILTLSECYHNLYQAKEVVIYLYLKCIQIYTKKKVMARLQYSPLNAIPFMAVNDSMLPINK